jgi:hypothetical protein
MRASLTSARVVIEPGRWVPVGIEVTNTSGVIDGISATLRAGPPGAVTPSGGSTTDTSVGVVDPDEITGLEVRTRPGLLPLFPDGTGVITLELKASDTFLAGMHDMNVIVRSSVDFEQTLPLPIEVEVVPMPGGSLRAEPLVRSGRHKSTFRIISTNSGNVPLDISLAASDPERVVLSRFSPATVTVSPGEQRAADMAVVARRHFFGGDVARAITVLGTAGPFEVDTRASFRHQPVIPRGLRTVLTLGAIVALWAAVFVVAIDKALTKDKVAKAVPPSFYASTAASRTQTALGGGGRFLFQNAADATPAGAVPKSGVVIGVGGTINGTVTAKSTGAGIGRITVEAVEDTKMGPQLISSAATGTDGTYSLVGLLPGPYKLLFTAQGYQDVWYPSATAESGASPVNVDAQSTTTGINVSIAGLPGSIKGQVDTGQTPQVPVTVTVLPGQGSTTPIATVTTGATGAYTVPNLPAPGTYDLSFQAPGYQVGSDTEELAGGEARVASTVTLSAGPGTLSGTVTDGTNPLGGVTITANSQGQTITSATPTTGAIGQFTIPNLATPATYLLTFAKTGFGTVTIAEHLGPGQQLTNIAVAMAGGAGLVSGTVTSPTGQPLGGVTVTVVGGQAAVTTQTLTAGRVGFYELSGLATPGTYTLTFSLGGFQNETVGVALTSSGSASNVNVTLPIQSGTIGGTVKGPSAPLTGVAVSMTNGTAPVRTTVSSSSPPGGFTITGLAPGHWSVTFTMTGFAPLTALVDLQPGQTANLPVTLSASS